MQGNMIKQQFEQILKDTKILCELEPFVKKWSFDEMLPHFEITDSINESNNLTLEENLRDVKLKTAALHSNVDDDHKRAHQLLRKLKEKKRIMMAHAGNDDNPSRSLSIGKSVDNNILLEDQYDRELKTTLKALEEIEDVDAVTQTDIDDFIRGLGGKPDGFDLKTTNIREWKNIFLEHWFDLQKFDLGSKEKTNAIKCGKILPNIIKPKSPTETNGRRDELRSARINDRPSPYVCTSSRVNLDGHFMTRKERKNMADSIKLQGESGKSGLHSTSSSSPYTVDKYCRGVVPSEKKKSLLTLRKKGHHETSLPQMGEKTASSALVVTSLPRYKKLPINDFKSSGDNFYGDRERQTKKMVGNNCLNEVKFKAEAAKKTKNRSQSHSKKNRKPKASVRPSSAVPKYGIIPLTGGVSKFSVVKGKIR